MLNSDNDGGNTAVYLRNQGPTPSSLVEQQVLVAATAAAQGFEYAILDPAQGEDGRWRGVDDDHGEA